MLAPRLTTATCTLLVSLFFVMAAFAQPTKIRLASTAATSTEKVAFALAKDAGILKKHNIDLEVILITGGPVAMQALLAKSLDIVTTSATVFLHGFVEGADVKISFTAKGGQPGDFTLEGAAAVTGAYATEPGATVVALGPDQFQATAPANAAQHFFRIRQ